MRGRLAKRRNRRDDIGPAAFESAVRAFAIADPPPVEAKHRMARCRHALRQHRHPAMRAAANLVAARHDQQPVAAGRIVERSEEHTYELPSLMRISYAVFRLQKNKSTTHITTTPNPSQ